MKLYLFCLLFLLNFIVQDTLSLTFNKKPINSENETKIPSGIPPAVWQALQNRTASILAQKSSIISAQIVNGSETTIEKYPHQASMRVNGRHICGACIITKWHLLTAAHCSDFPIKSTSFAIGSTKRTQGGTIMYPASKTLHPSYNKITQDYDISVYKTSKEMVFTLKIAAVALPNSNFVPADGALADVSGWGALSSKGSTLPINLMVVAVPIVSRTTCKTNYGSQLITNNMICAGFAAGGKDSCQGDSGGPLVTLDNGKIVLCGIVSWGNGCAFPNYPGVYTNVAILRTWIDNNTTI